MKKGELDKTVVDPRFNSTGQGGSNIDSPQTTVIKFPIDQKHELRRIVCHNNHNNGRNFKINEEMMKIYEANIHLQCKLDDIAIKGAGNYSPKSLSKTFNSFKSPHNFTIKKRFPSFSGQVEPIQEKTRVVALKGSLNHTVKKREQQRIQEENLRMAKRII